MFNRVLTVKSRKYRCLKRVQIRSFSCPYFPVLELNQKNSEKLRTRKTPYSDNFYVVYVPRDILGNKISKQLSLESTLDAETQYFDKFD